MQKTEDRSGMLDGRCNKGQNAGESIDGNASEKSHQRPHKPRKNREKEDDNARHPTMDFN